MNKNLCIRRAIKRDRFGAEWGRIHQPRDPDKAGIVWVPRSSRTLSAHRREKEGILSRVSAADLSGIVELLPRNLFHLHIRMGKHAPAEGLYRPAAIAAIVAAVALHPERNRLYDITLPVEARDIRFMRPLHLRLGSPRASHPSMPSFSNAFFLSSPPFFSSP